VRSDLSIGRGRTLCLINHVGFYLNSFEDDQEALALLSGVNFMGGD
jgi:hypothetical protein